MEVHVGGDRKKDAEVNLARYARLGIPEYFIYDRARQHLHGYRLARDSASYVAIAPRTGGLRSDVLDLELVLERGRLRFFHASAELLAPRDLAERLGNLVAQVTAERDAEAERALAAEAELARVREELDKLRGQ